MRLMAFVKLWAVITLLLLTGIELFMAFGGLSGEAIAIRLVSGLYITVWASALAAIVVSLLAIVFTKAEA
jgi:uncharacterized membrane protein YjjB (DUF3815 family)